MGPVAHIHDKLAWQKQGMAYLRTARDKKSHNHEVGEKTKSHAVRLSRAFRRVNGKEIRHAQNPRSSTVKLSFIEISNREASRDGKCNFELRRFACVSIAPHREPDVARSPWGILLGAPPGLTEAIARRKGFGCTIKVKV